MILTWESLWTQGPRTLMILTWESLLPMLLQFDSASGFTPVLCEGHTDSAVWSSPPSPAGHSAASSVHPALHQSGLPANTFRGSKQCKLIP